MVQTVISTALVSYLLMVFVNSGHILFQNKETTQQNDYQLSHLKSKILNQANFSQSWLNTYATDLNVFKSCVEGTTEINCMDAKATRSFALINATGGTLISRSGATFDSGGHSCVNPSGNMTNDSLACPYKVSTQWKPLCDEEMCYQVALSFKFFQLVGDSWVEKEAYNFTVLKNMTFGGPFKNHVVNLASSPTTVIAPAKIVIFIDTSDSMVPKEARVKKALVDFLHSAKGIDAKVYFYSTASVELPWDDTNYKSDSPLSEWIARTSPGEPFENSKDLLVYEVRQSGSTFSSRLQPDITQKLGIEIKSGLPSDVLETNVQMVFDFLRPEKGTDRESGICGLTRMVNDSGPNNILDPSDSVHFMVITDEDDFMAEGPHDHCEKSLTTTNETVIEDRPCDIETEACTSARIFGHFSGPTIRVHADYQIKDSIVSTAFNVCAPSGQNSFLEITSCPWDESLPYGMDLNCDSIALDQATVYRDKKYPGFELLNCRLSKRDANQKTTSEVAEPIPASVFNVLNASGDRDCSIWPVTRHGTNYIDMQNLVQNDGKFNDQNYTGCSAEYFIEDSVPNLVTINEPFYKLEGHTLSSTKGSLLNKIYLDEYYQNIVDTLNSKVANYSITAIIHDKVKDPPGCDIMTGDYGVEYSTFLSYTNSANNIYSICNDTYDVPFQQVEQKIRQSIGNVYHFDNISNYETLSGVRLMRNGEQIFLQSTDYTITDHSITFSPGVIAPGDNIIALSKAKAIF